MLLTPSSGIFETNSGTSSAFVGVLTKEATLRAKETEQSVLGSAEYRRLVGGRGLGAMGVAHIRHHLKHHGHRGMKHTAIGGRSGGSSSGGAIHHPVAAAAAVHHRRNRLSHM